MAIDSALFAE